MRVVGDGNYMGMPDYMDDDTYPYQIMFELQIGYNIP